MADFEYKATIEDGTSVVLRFKAYGDAPGRISRRNIGDMERQVWEYLEWGISEPKSWPEGTDHPGYNVLDELKQRDITKCYQDWQASDIFGQEEEEEKKPEKQVAPKDFGS